jgi:hypothetical protein
MPYKSVIDRRRNSRRHYEENRPVYLSTKTHTREQVQAYLRKVKDVPCADCGVKYPFYVMQFDHLGDKAFNISMEGRNGSVSWARLSREVAKCEVVCANCHAERTYQRIRERGTTAAVPGPVQDEILTLF